MHFTIFVGAADFTKDRLLLSNGLVKNYDGALVFITIDKIRKFFKTMPPTNANPLGNAANAASSATNQSGKDGASMRPPLYNSEDYCAGKYKLN